MLAGRGVALGFGGGMNLTDLSKAATANAQYYKQRHQQARRSCSLGGVGGVGGGSRKNSESTTSSSNFASLTSPSKPSKPPQLADILDLEDDDDQDRDSDPMEEKKKKIRPSVLKKQQEQEEKKRVLVKRAFNRRTFFAACRAIIFGCLLLFLGVAMCTIGYYNDYFSMEIVLLADNVTAIAPNVNKKFQYQSLTYIGPVVMGAGAFVLMMACVTTLETRDRQARIYQEQQAALDAERTPLSRRNTLQKKSITGPGPGPPPPLPGPSALKSTKPPSTLAIDTNPSVERGGSINRKTESKPIFYQQADLVAPTTNPIQMSNGLTIGTGAAAPPPIGVINRSFTRDDSKTTSKPDTDSGGPSGTTTTTLTWSKNGGPKCEAADVVCNKYPSSSCLDNLHRKPPDERALLQRFLEDQSRLVEDRLNRRIQQQQKTVLPPTIVPTVTIDEGNRNATSDVSVEPSKSTNIYPRNLRSDEPAAPSKNVIAAEIHHAGDASPNVQRIAPTTTTIDVSSSSPQVPTTSSAATDFQLKAPVLTPELFSPMSVSPDTPASTIMQNKLQSKSTQLLLPVSSPTEFLNTDRSISGSYVTVREGGEEDLFNANSTTIPALVKRGGVYNNFSITYNSPRMTEWPPPPPPVPLPPTSTTSTDPKKLYDSVFLAENLRQKASAVPTPPPASNLRRQLFLDEEKLKNDQQQTGVLCKDLHVEMNANYLRNQQNL